jgi:hypothetical protein
MNEVLERLDQLTFNLFGRHRSKCLKNQTCVMCGGEAKVFEDSVSENEYIRSAMCQQCQDDVFEEVVNK